ncbi:HIT domain-containing protein [Streptomyces sp. NPDC051896]|uniref:HIT family protein n=1 Tax=Streptomyces sp. NPDC051896 TaxID=3155416 RepID=UPI003422D450
MRPEWPEACVPDARRAVSRRSASGVNILSASGPASEQSVPHLHFHVVPRWADDQISTWPAGRSAHQLAGDPRTRLAEYLAEGQPPQKLRQNHDAEQKPVAPGPGPDPAFSRARRPKNSQPQLRPSHALAEDFHRAQEGLLHDHAACSDAIDVVPTPRHPATSPTQEPVWPTTTTTATFPTAVRENKEVVPVNTVSTWVLPSGVTVGR